MKFNTVFSTTLFCGLIMFAGLPIAFATETSRQAEVRDKGAVIMPFQLKTTTHFFAKKQDGGIQQVVAKDPHDNTQIRLIREHLQKITQQFRHQDFSDPATIHGASMPGLRELQKAKSGEINITYQDLPSGGQIRYSTENKKLIKALHRWFDAQMSDHGADAKEGSMQHDMMKHH
ncbi:MAG: hypothetical protein PHV54_14515 [Tolumonas sp.]|nr:hypothetical protein [Tolumonas sp.]